MKLKDTFIVHHTEDNCVMVPVGGGEFHGLVRLNKTAEFIVSCLSSDTTEEKIVDAMAEKYDAERSVLENSVKGVLEKLRGIGAIEE